MRILFIILTLLFTQSPAAHETGNSYLDLRVVDNQLSGSVLVPLRDLDTLVGVDINADRAITWGEFQQRHEVIQSALDKQFTINANESINCKNQLGTMQIDKRAGDTFAYIPFTSRCAEETIETIHLDYRLMFDIDTTHRAIVNISSGNQVQTAIFSPDQTTKSFSLASAGSLATFSEFVVHGIWHIWIGWDHILFILTLLLPLTINMSNVTERHSIRTTILDIIKVVTAFTVAHSITLVLASLNILSAPMQIIETLIAASIIVAALNNLLPIFNTQAWKLAFAFGLLHGFGFASVLSDLLQQQSDLALVLFSFNLGIELGQLAIVAAWIPLAWGLGNSRFYRLGVVKAGSIVIILVAGFWVVERSILMAV